MPRRALSEDEVRWLRDAHGRGATQPQMAAHIGVCVDTVKRMLVRHGIASFDGAKYLAVSVAAPTHTKPCLRCGDCSPRPIEYRLCDGCRDDIRQMAV